MRSEPAAKGAAGLDRSLNAWDIAFLVAGSIVGGAIFLTPASIARGLPSETLILAAFILGGLFTLAGSFVYSELGAMLPETGGNYLYLREAYGDLAGFLYGWVAYFVILSGSAAAVAVSFAEFLGSFIPSIGTKNVLFSAGGFSISAGQLVAVAAVLVLSGTHYIGVREGARVQSFFTSLILVTLIALIVGAVARAVSGASTASGRLSPPPGAIGLSAFGVSVVAVLWTYEGGNYVASVTGEVRNPQRNLPLGLILGTGAVTLIYVAVNWAYLGAIPVVELARSARPAELAATRIFGDGAARWITGAIVASTFGCTSASIVFGPRIVYALAKDRLFPAAFGRSHPRFHTPSFALGVQAVWASVLCLSGRYDQIYSYVVFIAILAYAATGAALFLFRAKRPSALRPYRCLGYPVVPFLYVVGCLLFLAATVAAQPRETLAGLVILALGLPVYFRMKTKQKGAP
jgi:APA family basic amino acid/polyamine antiporter